MKSLHIFGREIIDENAIAQIQNCINSEEDIPSVRKTSFRWFLGIGMTRDSKMYGWEPPWA